jgi:peptide-methionine (S)-S-oxide reductase
MFGFNKATLPRAEDAPAGRKEPLGVINRHYVTGRPINDAWLGLERVALGAGCFWGIEKKFWGIEGVETTAVGYAGGYTENPTYREVCDGRTGHNEVVLVVFDPKTVSLEKLLKVFWENHDPTQGMRQGNDVGTQYRSGIYTTTPEQLKIAEASRDRYQARLNAARHGKISTEIVPLSAFYYAEDYHQQYLAKHPDDYCGGGGTGVSCPVGVDA